MPRYQSKGAEDTFMDQKIEQGAFVNPVDTRRRWEGVHTDARSGFIGTMWGWQGLTHQCPTGMIMNGIWAPEEGYESDILAANVYNDAAQLRLDYKSLFNRLLMFCECLEGDRTSCNNHGTCETMYAGDLFTPFSVTQTNGPQWGDWYERKAFKAPPTGGRMQWRRQRGNSESSVGIHDVSTFPTHYGKCVCDDDDYVGLFCEKDIRRLQTCGDGKTIERGLRNTDRTVCYTKQDPDCIATRVSLGQPTTSCLNTTSCYPDPDPTAKLCLCQFPEEVNGAYQLGFRFSRFPDPRNPNIPYYRLPYQMCIENLDYTRCGHDDGVTKRAFGYFNNNNGLVGFEDNQCECFIDGIERSVPWPDDTYYQLVRPNLAGPHCTASCRDHICHSHGQCKYIRRDQTRMDQTFVPYGSLVPNTLHSNYVLDTDHCDCDFGYNGDHCEVSDFGGIECDGLRRNSPNTLPMGSSCAGVLGDNGNGACIYFIPQNLTSGDVLTWRQVIFNSTSYRCQIQCAQWITRDATDITSTPNNLECGGPVRGVCLSVNEVTSRRECKCNNGFDGESCEKVVCPRYAGMACGGIGTCDLRTRRCICPTGLYGDACQLKRFTSCDNFAQNTYNGA